MDATGQRRIINLVVACCSDMKLEAIKYAREIFNIPLKEAKELVEEIFKLKPVVEEPDTIDPTVFTLKDENKELIQRVATLRKILNAILVAI